MHKVERLLGRIDNLNERVGRIVSYLCLLMMAVLMWEIVLRYFFNNPTIWAHETSALLYGTYFVLGGAYVLRHRAHVTMDIIYNRFSVRRRAILDLVGSSLFFIFCGLLLWEGGQLAWASLQLREYSETFWGPPLYPLKMTVPIGGFLILLQGLAKFIRDLNIAITGREIV